MSLPDAVIDALVEAGCTPQQLAAAMKAANAGTDARREAKRANNAERQRRFKERQRASDDQDNAGNALPSVTERDCVTAPALSPAPFLSPQTPQTNPHPHTHPDIYIPRAKADPFPMLDCTDRATWEDFRSNRKAKRLPCTATAHAKLNADLAKWSDRTGWPPGEVFAACVAKGWGAIYDPRDSDDGRNKQQRPKANGGNHVADDGRPMGRTEAAARAVAARLASTGNGARCPSGASPDPDAVRAIGYVAR